MTAKLLTLLWSLQVLLLVFVFNSNLRSHLIRPDSEDVVDTDEDVMERLVEPFYEVK